MEKERPTEAEAVAWEKRMASAGISVEPPTASTITLLEKRAKREAELREDDDGSGVVE